MKKIMIATLGLSLLSGSAIFAQNTSSTMTGSEKTSTKVKHKKGKKGETSSTTSTTSTSK